MENMITPKDDSENEKVVNNYPLEVSLKLNKNVYTNNEKIIGFLKIVFTKDYSISDINVKLVQVFSFKGKKSKDSYENNLAGSVISIKDYAGDVEEIPSGVMLFPFTYDIPSNAQPTVCYYNKNYKCSVISFIIFDFFDKVENKRYTFTHEINMVNLEKNFYKPLDYKANQVNEKDFSMELSSDSNKYSYGDIIQIRIKIKNSSKDFELHSVKLSLYLKVTWNKFENRDDKKEIENKKINTKTISIDNSDKEEFDIKDTFELIYNRNSIFGFSHSEPNQNELKINSDIISSTTPSSDYITLERMCDDDKGNIRSDGFSRLKMKMPPSVNSKVLNIEYYIKATVYFKQFVGYNSRPRAFLYFSLVD